MSLLQIVVHNTQEVAKPLPFLEHQTLWSSLLQQNMPVLEAGGWRAPEGTSWEHFLLETLPTNWITLFLFSFPFFSSYQPFVLGNIRSVSFLVHTGWKQQGLTVSKIALGVCSRGCEGVGCKLNLRGQSTGIRQEQESSALVSADHPSVKLQNQMSLGISLVPWRLSPSTPHCSFQPEADSCSKSVTPLEIVWWLELEYQTPNSD